MKIPLYSLVTLICLFTSIGNSSFAQIPNNDFEVWDSSGGYKTPVGWDNMNPVTYSTSILTCERMVPGHTGLYHLALNTQTVSGSIVPGIAVSGLLDPTTHKPASGFPYTSRPQVLAGAWQYMAYTTADQGFIEVLLSKWNTTTSRRDTIAFTHYLLPGMVMYWADFHLPLTYYSTANPDSAIIFLSASGPTPVAYSFLWVDGLRFADSATLNTNVVSKVKTDFTIIPNPTHSFAQIEYYSGKTQNVRYTLIDVAGRNCHSGSFTALPGNNSERINVSGLPKGLYFIKLIDEFGIAERKLTIN
jgi:Secretion system C-terminal sorting domain